ncbi:MAG: amidohydrolase [Armatimonadetes bacterium]|nr:amidohydrolase [Armatimonadota bacterium]
MLSLLVACLLTPQPADLVIENARIWSDGRVGFAEFAAVRDGRFVYVGPKREEFIGEGTERVNARGRVVLPGLIDSHVHMMGGGASLTQLYLRDAKDKPDFIRLVEEWADGLPAGKWVLGGRWSVESWAVREQPTKEWVDPVTGDRPLYLSRMDGHSALVNSAALRLAGITKDGPPDPEGGVIDRDAETGEPTGILRESAMGIVSRHIPATTFDDRVEALKRAMEEANRNGVTAVSDIPGLGSLPVYERLAESGDLTVRFFLYPTAGDWQSAAETVKGFKAKKGWVEVKGFKAFVDGSLGSRTAFMREPFFGNEPGRENWRGLLTEGVEDGRFARNAAAARDAGMQTIVHAIGDEANHILLNTLADVYQDIAKARCRSEHAQHLLPEDIFRFGELGLIASMQPYHKADDGRYAEDYIGAERCRSSYAFKSLLNAGAVLAFGSDWPVVSINPFLGIEAAVTGRTLDGKLWQTQENISVGEALRCYTSRGAYAAFAEDEIGKIAPGFRADFVILNRSPFDANPQWSEIRPTAVYVEGKLVFP